jgi:hypothetical protein
MEGRRCVTGAEQILANIQDCALLAQVQPPSTNPAGPILEFQTPSSH